MLQNAIAYGYNIASENLGDLFQHAEDTTQLDAAFKKLYNMITEKVGFENVVVTDGIATAVTSSTVVDGDVSGFTYIIRDNTKALAYKVTVAPNGEWNEESLAEGTPIFTFADGTRVVGSPRKIKTDDDSGQPILDDDGKLQTDENGVEVYYCMSGGKEYIMPIATPSSTVTWDLSPLGVLQDGYSYEVNFVVWPNQESYDLVADLNNGKRPDIEATGIWDEIEDIQYDSSDRPYKQGGFPDYPYISRYEDDGVYSAMSNTNQQVSYKKIDTKIINNEEQTEITGPFTTTVEPPGPMPLTASYSHIEKLWRVERQPAIFAQYLYNTDGSSKGFTVTFDVYQGSDLDNAYKTVTIGWVYDLDANGHYIELGANETGDYVLEEGTGRKIKGHYDWSLKPGESLQNVTYSNHAHQIGPRWATDFSIATGLMLTSGEMEELGLNKSLYPSAEFENETYYILEPGHDYTIKERGAIGYEFDFISPVYHPMLIDGVLKNVEIKYTYKTVEGKQVIDTAEITSITGSEEGLSGLEVENTLRGYLNINKIVVDEQGTRVDSDETEFEYTVKLDSTLNPGPFEGTHVPWYGVNGLFYHDANMNYYQVYEATNGAVMIKIEAGREYEVTSEGFNPDSLEWQTVTYTDQNDQTISVTLHGNVMTSSNEGKHAEVTVSITQKETLYIANIPVDTVYTVTESDAQGYYLIDILKEVKHGEDVEKTTHVAAEDLPSRTATGTIVTNRDNHVTYTNQIRTGTLTITKEIQKNGSLDTSATGTFYYAVYDEEYDSDADPEQKPVRTGSIEVTSGGTATVTEDKLKIRKYYIYELTSENGTPITEGGIFNGGKYYEVTTEGSPVTVSENTASSVGIINNYQTTRVNAKKTWAREQTGSNPTTYAYNPSQLTVYFKLFYENAAGVAITTGTPLKSLTYEGMNPSNGEIETYWDNMPVYDANGQPYKYIVKEYILDEEHGEFEEDGHKYTESAPNGYINTEDDLTVTNSKLETYEPVTTYSGRKYWVDTANGSSTRPDGLTVTLMIDNEPYGERGSEDEPAVVGPNEPHWVTVDEDEWQYTFSKLPMFDNEQQLIRYYAVETPVNGYEATPIGTSPETQWIQTTYSFVQSSLAHTENDAYPVMNSDADLVYTAVRIQYEGHLHHIWTQREPTTAEKETLVNLVNQDLINNNLTGDATVDNVRWVSGLPMDHEFVYSPQSAYGYKIKLTRYNTNTIHLEVNNHGAFSNICYGTLQYNYTAGSTNFENKLKPRTYNVEKYWANDAPPPKDAVAVIELQGTVTKPKDPQPADATETVYETVKVDLTTLGVTQKIQVTLNGGLEGGDDTATAWKYTWSNLPPCDKAGYEITYSVKEISYKIGGHDVSLTEHAFPPTLDDTTKPDTTIVTNQIPSYSFILLKIDEKTARPLPGAEFTLQEIEPTSNVSEPATIEGEIYSSTPERTGTDGKVTFSDIPLGYYEVRETKTPDGYVITNDGKFYIRVDTDSVKLLEKVISEGDDEPKLTFREVSPGVGGRIILGNIELTTSGNTITFTVENTPGAALPNAGGPGTRLFTILGSILILGAGVLLWRKRRLI